MSDATQKFLESLPEIKKEETFWFSCHPKVPCFNACCSDLNMPLTPYDVLRLCQGLNLGSEAFIDEFARVSCYPDTGFPVLYLRMEEDIPDAPCPFLTIQGCGVYMHRSSACRTYPLGRATRLKKTIILAKSTTKSEAKPEAQSGQKPEAEQNTGLVADFEPELEEHYFLVREDHCKGFEEKQDWTSATWLQDQGLEPYNAMNDLFSKLIAKFKHHANNALLSEKHATMALLCLYQQDRFKEFMLSTNILEHIEFIGAWEKIPKDELKKNLLEDDEERLRFGFAWMELVLFGKNALIVPNNKK